VIEMLSASFFTTGLSDLPVVSPFVRTILKRWW